MPVQIDPVALAREAMARDDREMVADLFDSDMVELWFCQPVDDAMRMLRYAAEPIQRRAGQGVLLLHMLGAGGPVLRTSAPDWVRRFADAVSLRLRGDPVEAWRRMRSLDLVADPVPPLADAAAGTRALVLGQAGVSALLAGDFTGALAVFAKAEACQVPDRLRFLHREALVRQGLVHALFGDVPHARALRQQVEAIPRTESWVEAVLDSDTRLLDALLRPIEDAVAAREQVRAFPVAAMQEMWPLYVAAGHRLAVITDDRDYSRGRIAQLEAAGLVGSTGKGFAGSILPYARAIDELVQGRISRAQAFVAAADPEVWPVPIARALIGIARGESESVARSVSASVEVLPHLPIADDLRSVVVVLAALRESEDAALRAILDRTTPIDPYAAAIMGVLAPEFAARVAERVPDWPAPPGGPGRTGILDRPLLTARELDTLRGLARGRSRAKIAQDMFVSENTVKSHQRSLYRKLGVSTRADALVEAHRRGLLGPLS